MDKSEFEKAVNSMSDTYLEEMINAHPEHTAEDLDIINNILSYRVMTVPLKLKVKNHHYATVLRKTGTLPNEIMFDKKYVDINQFVLSIKSGDDEIRMLVVLTRASKFDKKMGKANAMVPMAIKEIYNSYLLDKNNYFGIAIFGANEPYFVSTERIEQLLGIESDD